MGKTFVSGGAVMTVPVAGMPISDVAVGSIVKLNENGSPVEFYVAKHDYESGLNGAGRTLLVRKDCYDERVWNSELVNAYATSDIDSWLNGTYKALLDADIQGAINTTKFYYTPGNDNNSVTTLTRAIFLLSVTELGQADSNANVEGSRLPIYSTIWVAYHNGSRAVQWTRTPSTDRKYYAYVLNLNGEVIKIDCNFSYWSRPCFTLPATAKVQDDGTIKI